MASQRGAFDALPDEFSSSSSKHMHKLFQGRYTRIGTQGPEVDHAFRSHVAHHLEDILSLLQSEARYALDEELGWPEQWTSVPLHRKLRRIVALLTGRIFVGRPLSRNNEWLKACVDFTEDSERVKNASLKVNRVIRPFVVPFMPEVANAVQNLKRGEKCLEPIVADVMAQAKRNLVGEKRTLPKPGEKGAFMSWVLDYLPFNDPTNAERVAIDQLIVCFTSIYNTTRLLGQVIQDLASQPELIQLLTEEIEEVVADRGLELDDGENRYFPEASLAKLEKLQTFILASQGSYSDEPNRRQSPTLATYEVTVVLVELLQNYEFKLGAREAEEGPGSQTAMAAWKEPIPDGVVMLQVRRRG
ncbi:hypothetical protein GE09DRAFT_1284464 [Coniochaeta sp. 2T2.1]|nr:hypothetical protein GE09DRAFT_1284464 [Coniochaeta sp. 2T2.1]